MSFINHFFVVFVVLTTSFSVFVSCHTWLESPKPKLTVDEGSKMLPAKCQIQTPASLSMTWPGPPGDNAKGLIEYLKNNKKSLKEFSDESGCRCGLTDPSGNAPIPSNGQVILGGLIHEGPCEAWIGDERVYSNDAKCPASFPVNYRPGGMLRVILAATHAASPEMYDFCVNLGSNGYGSSSNSSGSSSSTSNSSGSSESDSSTYPSSTNSTSTSSPHQYSHPKTYPKIKKCKRKSYK